ncbi:MAG: AI-2E family transporter [Chloroflexi bacterium]|nr:AI-2E family transporter [Chloroflexota bacterium]
MKSEWSLPARYFALTLVIVFLVFIVYQVREMIRPLILAGVIAYLFYPFVSLLQQHFKLNRRQASNVVYFASLAVMIALPIVLVPILSRQTTEIAFDLQQVLTQAEQYLAKPIIVGGAVLDLSSVVAQYKNALLAVFSSTPQNAIQLIRNTSRNTLWGIVVLVSTYFFMTEWENLREGMIRLAPETYRQDIRRLYAQIRQVWTAYLRGQLTLMLIVAVTFIIVWTAIGLPGSLYLGFLAGLFSIVPDVGPFVATVLALTVALLEGSKWLPINNFLFGLLVVVLYAVLINIKGIWLRPRILGRSVHMHEAVVFVAIIAAVIFTGVLGAFIIIPVLASLGVIWNYLHARILGLVPFQDEKYASYPDLEAPAVTDKKNTSAAKAAKKRSK